MNPLKKLAGQTAVYGLSSILGRILGYLLVPIYTRVLAEAPYGSVVELYSYIALLLVILTYGMETAFFRFSESSGQPTKVFSSAFLSILGTSSIFIILIFIFNQPIADLIRYPNHADYIVYLGLILFFDSINTIPFAKLRAENRAKRFVAVRLTGIFVNIGLNLILILFIPYLLKEIPSEGFRNFINSFYNEAEKVDYILISNVISSGIMTLMFLPDLLKLKFEFDKEIWKKLIIYAMPLLVFGLAGVLNEVLDRILLKYLLPPDIALEQVGIYGAVYKVSILMTIFIQAYRYAAEPFFFAHEKHKDAKEMYANMMNYFVIITSLIFLSTMLYMDIIIHFIGERFRSGAPVIPILLLANLFLGIYYNLSVWYKLTNKTKWGAYISLVGAIITITLNLYWIPRIGYTGSAWATFYCYGSMMILSLLIGRKYYPIPYNIGKIALYLGISVGLYFMSLQFGIQDFWVKMGVNSLLLLAYLGLIYFMERDNIRKLA
jgi:O-antigen/teichoic acid export membrane protein